MCVCVANQNIRLITSSTPAHYIDHHPKLSSSKLDRGQQSMANGLFRRQTFGPFVALSAEVEPVPLVLRSDTVIYDAATQRPVDELLVTFHLAYRHISVCQSLLDAASGYLVHLRSPRRCLLVPCKHIINLCRATTAVSWRPTTR